MADFELTEDDINLNIWISTGASAASLVLCAAVLGASAWVWRKPHLRPYIDRVSFRLLLWSMVFEVAYDVVYIAVELYSYYEIVGPLCAGGVYFMMAFVGVVNYLCTCIAVNLMLTITFGMNPIKQRLERWYVGISIALGMFVPIIPAALGHFGFDPVLQVCWITGRTDEQRMRYFILDLYLWQILSCVLATAAVIATLTTLFRQRRATSAALFSGNQLNRAVLSKSSWSDNSDDAEADADVEKQNQRQSRTHPRYLWTRITGGPALSRPDKLAHTMSQLEDRFLRIALKISCYPVALIVVNGLITIGDLYISKEGGVYSRSVYALYCVYYFLYGGRGIVFAFLAFFIDPCLRIGLRAAWTQRFHPARPLPGLDLETTVLDSEEKSFSEMLAMPSPVLPQVAEKDRGRDRRGAAVKPGEGKDEDGAHRRMSVASTTSDASEAGLVAVGEKGIGEGDRDGDSINVVLDSLAAGAGSRRRSSTSIDMPAALSRLAFEQNGPGLVSSSDAAAAAGPSSGSGSGGGRSPRGPRTFSLSFRHASPGGSHASTPRPTSPALGGSGAGPAAPRASTSSARPLSPAPVPTRSFAGVDRDSLPREMTDDLDIVRRDGHGRDRRDGRDGSETRGILLAPVIPASSANASAGDELDKSPSQAARRPSVPLDPLAPDLPDHVEQERLRRRAWREQKRLEKEEAIRAFLETKAML